LRETTIIIYVYIGTVYFPDGTPVPEANRQRACDVLNELAENGKDCGD
jgi:hypothetical protein